MCNKKRVSVEKEKEMEQYNKIEAMARKEGLIIEELWKKPEGVIITHRGPWEVVVIDAWVAITGDYITKSLFDEERTEDLAGCIRQIQKRLGETIETPYPIIIDRQLL